MMRWAKGLCLVGMLGLIPVQGVGLQAGPLLLYQAVDAAGQPLPELILSDAQGNAGQRIPLPGVSARPIELIATAAPGRALARTAERALWLVDAATASATLLDLPKAIVRGMQFNQPRFDNARSRRWVLLADNLLSFVYLLDLTSGRATNLVATIDPFLDFISGAALTPDGASALIVSDRGAWRVPTAAPETFARIAERLIFNFDFSDGGQLAYTQSGPEGFFVFAGPLAGPFEAVAQDARALKATFATETQLVLAREEALSLLTLSTRQERPLLSFPGGARAPLTLPGARALFSHDRAPFEPVWHWIDLDTQTATALPAANGFELAPTSAPRHQNWTLFQRGTLPGAESDFLGLNSQTGQTRAVTVNGAPLFDGRARRYVGLRGAEASGRFHLVTGVDAQGAVALWLLDAAEGTARALIQAPVLSAAFSPDGQAVVASLEGDATLLLVNPSSGATAEFGPGLSPVWVGF